ncbi:Protein of unknown function [Pyronema omphalodes CBS 100304]|uniref:Uncharacterized protein n=1 Tax=Pyronema omphalodes (strain CBS 100304) TaxID=1076935 RepID=U4KYN9_PYROM|nr:Protein of unknown function [Pyronema omphalodes CBS 100304]
MDSEIPEMEQMTLNTHYFKMLTTHLIQMRSTYLKAEPKIRPNFQDFIKELRAKELAVYQFVRPADKLLMFVVWLCEAVTFYKKSREAAVRDRIQAEKTARFAIDEINKLRAQVDELTNKVDSLQTAYLAVMADVEANRKGRRTNLRW